MRNWTESEKYCNEYHDGMATIQTSDEYINAIKAVPMGVTRFWVGLNDLEVEGQWVWSNGDECIEYENKTKNNTILGHDCSIFWRENEPNAANDRESCGEFKLYESIEWLLNDKECDEPYGVLCTQKR